MVEGGRRTGHDQYALVMDTVVDETGVDALREQLARARVESPGDVYVDCSALNFACLDALRVFVAAARVLGADDRRLVLAELSPYFVEVFQVTAWDRTPGLAFVSTATGSRYGSQRRTPSRFAAPPDPDARRTDPPAASGHPAP